ncbi:hypothetical protein [Methylosinus sporium]|uniref:Peptidase S24/S26A/S26B/S26C domain-containing protein n=1 Tax=Methylosinus sporium TaxID=428 RepID=A0A2U1SSV9_METSR|nr:hypothetical protein [Methylosinus sporium]PWB94699.1 hypothetical protein C5689_06440 [Methylosinus sporium]
MTDEQKNEANDEQTEALRQMIRERIKELGFSKRSLSLYIKRDASFIQDLVGPDDPSKAWKKPKKKSINTKALMDVEDALRFERGALTGLLSSEAQIIPFAQIPIKRKIPVNAVPDLPSARKIPLYERVNLRTGGVRMSSAAELETPIGLESNNKTFAVTVPDETMRPAFGPGHKVIVQEDAPLAGADFVFLEIEGTDGENEGFIRRLIGRTDEGLRVETLTPQRETVIQHAEILSVSPVVAVLFRK